MRPSSSSSLRSTLLPISSLIAAIGLCQTPALAVTVECPVVDDAFVTFSEENGNFGQSPLLKVGAYWSVDDIPYPWSSVIKINLAPLAGRFVQDASLKLYCTMVVNGGPPECLNGVSFDSCPWDELSITWNTEYPCQRRDGNRIPPDQEAGEAWWSFAVTDRVNAALALGLTEITFKLASRWDLESCFDDYGACGPIDRDCHYEFSSKEGAHPPYLEATASSAVIFPGHCHFVRGSVICPGPGNIDATCDFITPPGQVIGTASVYYAASPQHCASVRAEIWVSDQQVGNTGCVAPGQQSVPIDVTYLLHSLTSTTASVRRPVRCTGCACLPPYPDTLVSGWSGDIWLVGTLQEPAAIPESGAGIVERLDRFSLDAPPNPFMRDLLITYELPRAAELSLVIYDASGKAIRQLVHGLAPAGRHSVSWNGKSEEARDVPTGVYFVRLQMGAEYPVYRARKLVLIQ